MRVWKDLYLAVSKAKRGFSLDLLLATAEDLEKYRDAWATLYPKVLREGRVLYAVKPQIPWLGSSGPRAVWPGPEPGE